ncbi:MAG: transposase [Flavobacteriaceae bacterium]|nr:transposase [Flavobacteriaceae bacterium]
MLVGLFTLSTTVSEMGGTKRPKYPTSSSYIKEMYDTDISHTVLSQITDKVVPDDVKAWQNRPLEPLYCIGLDKACVLVKNGPALSTIGA